jgi:cholesterol transport system auxiliary component
MRALAVLIALCLALPLAASCVKLERQPIEKRFYALETVRPGALVPATKAQSPAVLLVRRLTTSSRLAGRELVYRTAPSAWTADYYNVFFVAPADMLTQDLRAWLTASGQWANVVDPSSLVTPSHILEGNITGLYADFAASPPQAVAEGQFLLLSGGPDERRVLLTRQYRTTAPVVSRTPQEVVRAERQAVTALFAQLEADLRQALAAR